MTLAESCSEIVELTRHLAAAHGETNAWRRVAKAAIEHAHELGVELIRTKAAYHRLREERRQVATSRDLPDSVTGKDGNSSATRPAA